MWLLKWIFLALVFYRLLILILNNLFIAFIWILRKSLHFIWFDNHLFFVSFKVTNLSVKRDFTFVLNAWLIIYIFHVLFFTFFLLKQISIFWPGYPFETLPYKGILFLSPWFTIILLDYIILARYKIIFWFRFILWIKVLLIFKFKLLYPLFAWHKLFKLFLTIYCWAS